MTDGGAISVAASHRYRDFTCGDLTEEHVGKTVRLAGWVMSIRNHGGIVFVDLRDQYGVTQVVVSDEQVALLNKEASISVLGKVLLRSEDTFNPNISTGKVELKADEIEVVGPCRSSLPFEVDQSTDTREDLRLKYRYLDLRNPKLKDNLILRAEVIKHLRREMEGMGFLEVQTPILANSSPGGARDYLVPSRKHKGKFYALPQAPQQFKQLLMASGFDRYFQIAPCFRDEDARLDRSPGEFYQLDFELAFATQEDVFAVAERVLTTTFNKFSVKEVSQAPYRRITFADSMLKYGSDKPDLRNPLEIIELTDFFANVEMPLFKGKIVRGLVVPGASVQSKSWFGSMEKFAISVGMKGLGYITVKEDLTYKGPIDKFLTDEQRLEIKEIAGLKPQDVLYFISDEKDKVAKFAGEIRTEVAKRLDLIDTSKFELCFITDYPMYELNEETGNIDFTHNPFSMPQGEMDALLNKDPLEIMAYQYDIVCNGVELSSGAVRNHRPDIMVKAFEIAGYSEKDVEEKFGALYSAFSYGAPPHAGMAPGVDRIVMLLAEEENIREIIAFPLNSNAQNLMLDAPSEVTEQQLRDVHIKVR
jgi:aspartyl-tRNA synthetase